MCLTYCVPLVDSLCSSVRVTHVSGVACVFRKEGGVCVRVSMGGWVACGLFSGCARACVNALKKNLFMKKFYRRNSQEKKKKKKAIVRVWDEAWILCTVFCFINLGDHPQCPSLLLYVLYQNITIECLPACLYPSNKGDFLSV